MESYLNTINLGQNCLGVQSASQRYFGKDVSDLTLSECAVIAESHRIRQIMIQLHVLRITRSDVIKY